MDTLKELVKKKYGKVQVFADKVGLTVGAVGNVLNGKRTLAWYHWDVWGEMLGIEPKNYTAYFGNNERGKLEWFADKIRDDISMYRLDCDFAEDDKECKECNNIIFDSIEKIIEKRYKEITQENTTEISNT